jgi:hypothetical protein
MDRVARMFGYRVMPEWVLFPSQIKEIDSLGDLSHSRAASSVAMADLRRENPRLLELRMLYQGLDEALKTPLVWSPEAASAQDLIQFRGDSMWLFQQGGQHLDEHAYLLAAYYVLANDRLRMMDKLTEDGAFGAITLEVAGRLISRDLLDSILEIDFLDRNLDLASRPDFAILDIGAGYGRLAHRILTAFPLMTRYFCADAIPESSFVCEYYLRFRGLENRSTLLTPLEIDDALTSIDIDLAVNIHSFSECTLSAVQWWIERLAIHHVRYFMIVPNGANHFGQLLRSNDGSDMLPIIEQGGYRLVAREAKYRDPAVQKFALAPTSFWLFERETSARK